MDGIKLRLQELESHVQNHIDTILSTERASPLVCILCNLGEYGILQSRRLRKFDIEDIDLLAFAARALMEAAFLLHYFTGGPTASLKLLVKHFRTDEAEIWQGVNDLSGGDSAHDGSRPDTSLESETENLLRAPSVAKLARRFGAEEEYKAFYKLYSKYVHPSAYFIFGEQDETHAEGFKEVFLERGSVYMSEMAERFAQLATIVKELDKERRV